MVIELVQLKFFLPGFFVLEGRFDLVVEEEQVTDVGEEILS